MCRGGWGSRSADSSQEIFLPPTIPLLPKCLLLSVTCQLTTETNQPTAAWVNWRQWWRTKQRLASLCLHLAGANVLWEGEEICEGERDLKYSVTFKLFFQNEMILLYHTHTAPLYMLLYNNTTIMQHFYFVKIEQDTRFYAFYVTLITLFKN